MSKATHIHVIDGKTFTYQNGQCPFCQPQTVQQQQPIGATAYTKGNTVVLKFSKASLLSVTYWTERKAYLISMSQIARDAKGGLIRDEKNNPIWQKVTRRITPEVLKAFIYELSALVTNMEGGASVPKRD